MVVHEAFYVSHSLEVVDVPSPDLADQFLPPFEPALRLDPAIGSSWGSVVNQDMFYRHRRALDRSMEEALAEAGEADRLWGELTGRAWGIVELYRPEDAELLICTMGSMAGTAREAVDLLRARGVPVGLLKVKLVRPVPAAALREALANVAKVMVLDRNFAPGTGGFLRQELCAVLYGLAGGPRVYGYLTGVGGTNVSPGRIAELAEETLRAGEPSFYSIWKG